MRKNAWLGGLILALTAGLPSADAIPEVLVQCPVLSEDERASVEARTRADLAVKGIEGGMVHLVCPDGTAWVAFRWGEFERASAVPLLAQGRARVEVLLALVDAVTTEVQNERTPPPASAPETPEREAAPPPAHMTEPVSGEPAAAPPPPVAAPVWLPLPRPMGNSAPPAEPLAHTSDPWHLGAGVEGELWATEVTGAAGLRLRAGRKLAAPMAVGVVLAGNLATSEPGEVSVRVWRAGVEAAACAIEALCFAAGTQLTRLVAEGHADWSPTSQSRTTVAGTLRVDSKIDLGPLELVPGAGVLIYPARRTVTLNGERMLSVPRVTGSAVLELRWPF